MHASTSLTIYSLLASSVASLGINCRGSSDCGLAGSDDGILQAIAQAMTNQIALGKQGDFYNEGKQIACAGDVYNDGQICAFFQNGASGDLQTARNLIQTLQDHGCKECGSVPTKSGNNVDTGELTVNYVHNPCNPCTKPPNAQNDNACICNPA